MERYRVQPGSHINLKQWDANDSNGFEGDKGEGKKLYLHVDQDEQIE